MIDVYRYEKLLIALIEDEAYTRQVIRQILSQIGVRSFVEAADGKSGLMEVVRSRPDIVFCDVHMQPLNGLQFLEGLRKIKVKGLDRTPVVMLTADTKADTVLLAKERAVAGYLVKPVSIAQVKARLDQVIAASPVLTAKAGGISVSATTPAPP